MSLVFLSACNKPHSDSAVPATNISSSPTVNDDKTKIDLADLNLADVTPENVQAMAPDQPLYIIMDLKNLPTIDKNLPGYIVDPLQGSSELDEVLNTTGVKVVDTTKNVNPRMQLVNVREFFGSLFKRSEKVKVVNGLPENLRAPKPPPVAPVGAGPARGAQKPVPTPPRRGVPLPQPPKIVPGQGAVPLLHRAPVEPPLVGGVATAQVGVVALVKIPDAIPPVAFERLTPEKVLALRKELISSADKQAKFFDEQAAINSRHARKREAEAKLHNDMLELRKQFEKDCELSPDPAGNLEYKKDADDAVELKFRHGQASQAAGEASLAARELKRLVETGRATTKQIEAATAKFKAASERYGAAVTEANRLIKAEEAKLGARADAELRGLSR